jgi:hypothetical protein
LGGTKTIPIDVRLLAATNRNLTQMMGDKLFRSDLYYRLKVFPITIPPLRDHPEDVPPLAEYFTRKYAREMSKQVETIPSDTMRALVSCPGPGMYGSSRTLLKGQSSFRGAPRSVFPWLNYGPIQRKLSVARSQKWNVNISSAFSGRPMA